MGHSYRFHVLIIISRPYDTPDSPEKGKSIDKQAVNSSVVKKISTGKSVPSQAKPSFQHGISAARSVTPSQGLSPDTAPRHSQARLRFFLMFLNAGFSEGSLLLSIAEFPDGVSPTCYRRRLRWGNLTISAWKIVVIKPLWDSPILGNISHHGNVIPLSVSHG